jgi:Tol biopolymer transport system component
MRRALLSVFGVLLGATALMASDPVATRQLQRAIDLVESRGDAKEAAALFEQAARSSDRELAARALFHLGDLQERLGMDRARAIYERIVREFSAQRDVAEQAQHRLVRLGGPAPTRVPALRSITTGDDADTYAHITPDGRFLARPDWYTGDLIVRDMRVGRSRRLMAKTGDWSVSSDEVEEAMASPDGSRVAFVWFAESGFRLQLRVMANGVGAKANVLVDKPEYDFFNLVGWSPDSNAVLVIATMAGGEEQIAWVSMEGVVTPLKTVGRRVGVGRASLSPDGKYVAYPRLASEPTRNPQGGWTSDSSQQHIHVLPTDGSGLDTAIVTGGNVNESPIWTPDGQHLLFVSNRDGEFGLWSVGVRNGKRVGNESHVAANISGRIRPIGMTAAGTFYFVPDRPRVPGSDIFVADLSGSGQVVDQPMRLLDSRVDSSRAPTWSPDGSRVAFLRRTPDKDIPFSNGAGVREQYEVVVRSANSGEERTFAETFLATTPPLWSHDGSAVYIRRDYNGGTLLRWELNSREARTVDSLAHAMLPTGWTSAALSPDDRALYLVVADAPQPPIGAQTVPTRVRALRLVVFDLRDGTQQTIWAPQEPLCSGAATRGAVCYEGPPTIAVDPTGRTLAMVAKRTDWRDARLARIGTDGAGYRELSTAVIRTSTISWTPDGRFVLAAQTGRDDRAEIVRVPAEGGPPVTTGVALRQPAGQSFHMSRDGRLVFSDRSRELELQLLAYDNIALLLNK